MTRQAFHIPGKPLPLVPLNEDPRQGSFVPGLSDHTTPKPLARASNLIKFFENAGSPSATTGPALPSRSQLTPRQDHLPGYQEAISSPAHAGSAHAPVQGHFSTRSPSRESDEHGVLAHLRKRTASPLRSARNVVAAWRGRVVPNTRSEPTTTPTSTTNSMSRDHNSELIAGQDDTGNSSFLRDAFVSIRRQNSTRPVSPSSETVPSATTSRQVSGASHSVAGFEKPLPLIIEELSDQSLGAPENQPRGKIVSTYTTLDIEVSWRFWRPVALRNFATHHVPLHSLCALENFGT